MILSVIIVSYNVKHYLTQCLKSIFASDIPKEEYEVLVIDNASSDGTPQYIQQQFPKAEFPNLKFTAGERNVGFGKANNVCVKHSHGKYILFLNPDTVVGKTTLRESIEFAENHPDMGGHGVMMLKDNGDFALESRRGLPTPWVSFCKMSGLQKLFPKSKMFGRYYMNYLDRNQSSPIDIISGAYFFTTRAALDKVGLFDENFFMYGEDIDLSYRMLLAGYQNYYLPTPILHYKGESTHKSTFRYVHVFYGAMLTFFKKHFRTYWLGVSLPVKFAILVKALLALTMGQMKKLKEFLLPIKKYKHHRFIYVGRHREQIEELAERWWLNMEYVETDQELHIVPQLPQSADTDVYTHVVYDAQDFDYSYILEAFQKSHHKSYIGVFYADQNALITASRVFSI